MRTSLFLVPLLAACTYPRYVATKTVEYAIPAPSTTNLICQTHNGNITVTGEGNTTQIAVRAELSVRGYTQGEADANLHLVEVGREQEGGTLRLFVKYPIDLSNCSPSGNFVLGVPRDIACGLESHNGRLSLRGTRGNVRLETHNGSIDATVEGTEVETTTHNGNIRLALAGSDPIKAEVCSHNGSIEMSLPENIGTMLDASTHNGKVVGPERGVAAATYGRSSLRGRIGDGTGSLTISTHNGNVRIR
jgi:DUF4097 and DUF4098 domain-containing protein YvlB